MNEMNNCLLALLLAIGIFAAPAFAQEPVPAAPSPSAEVRETVGVAAQSTVIVMNAQPEPTKKKIVPTIPPEQLRGKKNFIYALADIIWENALLLGVMIAGILIIFALYSREEEESSLEVSE